MRAWAGVALVALLGCEPPGPPLQYGPCDPARVAHVEAFGYYAASRHLDETSGYSSVHWGYAGDVAKAAALGMRTVVDLQAVFQIAWPSRPPDAEVEAAWRAAADELRPQRHAIAALYPSDEPYWNASLEGVPFGEVARRLEHAARVIRATEGFEELPIAVILANPELDWIAGGVARNPAGYTWLGFDYYAQPPERLERRAALLRGLLRPEQRVIAVPDAVFLPGHPHDLGKLEEIVAFWLAWVERHPEVVAVVPYIYWSWSDPDPARTWTGARDLPTIRARYEQIGACIGQSVSARAARARALAGR